MTCVSLHDLPPPSIKKKGWPWDFASTEIPNKKMYAKLWPKISVITPSFNQGKFLEETIRSVLLQGYPNIEYIIMDGGSSDESLGIIRKYERWISYWVSEKDNGQVDAVNRGVEISSGDIVSWLNSDDILLPECLFKVAQKFLENSQARIVFGERFNIDESGEFLDYQRLSGRAVKLSHVIFMGRWPFYQEAVFIKRSLWIQSAGLSEEYNVAFDLEFFLKCLKIEDAKTMPGAILGCWRHHGSQKLNRSISHILRHEHERIFADYGRNNIPIFLYKIFWSLGRRLWRMEFVDKSVSARDMYYRLRGIVD